MTATEIIRETQNLPKAEKLRVLHHLVGAMNGGDAAQKKAVARLLRRLENPDIPEDVWRGIEEAEDGRFVDMETALTQKPPWLPLARSSSSVSLSLGKNMKHCIAAIAIGLMGWHMLGCATRDASRGTETLATVNPLVYSNESHRKRIKQDASELAGVAKANMRILEEALCYNNETVRWAAQDALASMGQYAVPVLMNVLRHGDQRAMEHACNALQRIGLDASASIPLLLELLGSDVTTANYAARALSTVGMGSKIVLEGLKDAHERGLQSGGAIGATLQKLQRAAEESR